MLPIPAKIPADAHEWEDLYWFVNDNTVGSATVNF